MKVLFAHDTYYAKDAQGTVYAYGAFPYALWAQRFLPHFDEITIVGREKELESGDEGKLDISSGERAQHVLLPNINSPLKRILQGPKLFKAIKAEVAKADSVIIRGPVEFGMMAAKAARQLGKPYAVEMSGCAFDHTWYHGSLIGKLYAPMKYLRARAMVKHADQVIYVTQHFLQARYPAKAYADYASNVEIEAPKTEILEKRLERIADHSGPFTIGLIGNFGNGLKGLGVALESLSKVSSDFKFKVLGKGDPARWQSDIERLGLSGKVEFSGTLPGGAPVLEWLDSLDLYIQPSFHEGLPRALIEAMSCGLPALASNAGGSDELLPADFIHDKGDAKTLAGQINDMLSNPDMMADEARANFARAQDYTKDALVPRRQAFWTRFKSLMEDA